MHHGHQRILTRMTPLPRDCCDVDANVALLSTESILELPNTGDFKASSPSVADSLRIEGQCVWIMSDAGSDVTATCTPAWHLPRETHIGTMQNIL